MARKHRQCRMGNLLPMLIESDRGQTAWAAKLPILLAVLILAGGCQRDRTPGEKQARLIAAENMQLEKQLARQQDEIDKLNKQHAKDIEKLEDRLAACQRRNERLQQDLDKGIAERADSVRDTVMAENARLRREIERLKSQSPDNP